MTIAAYTPVTYAANVGTLVFAIPWAYQNTTHIKVYLDNVVVNPTLYVVTAPGVSGSVIFTVALVGTFVTITRELPFDQTVDFVNQGTFSASRHETTYDRVAMQVADLAEKVTRATKTLYGQTITDMPAAIEGYYLGWVSGVLRSLSPGNVSLAIPADNSVATAKLQDLSVTSAKLATSAVTGTKLDATVKENAFRSYLLNGEHQIDQRNTAAAAVSITSGIYVTDMWVAGLSGTSLTATSQRVANITTTADATYALKTIITGVQASLTGTHFFIPALQRIEGTFFKRAKFGTASAKTLYYSFVIRTTTALIGTINVGLTNAAGLRTYITDVSIPTAGVDQWVTGSIPGDVSGTWVTTTAHSASFFISMGGGPTTNTPAINTWQAGTYSSSSTSTNFAALGGGSGTIYITDIQLRDSPISSVMDFDRVPFDVEFMRCCRYLEYLTLLPSFSSSDVAGGATSRCQWWFKARKRATPSITLGGGSAVTTTTAFTDGVEFDRITSPVALTTGTFATAEL